MIRNESTSQLIASKNGDRDELLKLASRLMDRFIEDITPAIAGAVDNSSLPAGVIELAIINELCERASKEHIKKRYSNPDVRSIWDGKKEYKEELTEVVDKLKEGRYYK